MDANFCSVVVCRKRGCPFASSEWQMTVFNPVARRAANHLLLGEMGEPFLRMSREFPSIGTAAQLDIGNQGAEIISAIDFPNTVVPSPPQSTV
jgi:hypothetical protein